MIYDMFDINDRKKIDQLQWRIPTGEPDNIETLCPNKWEIMDVHVAWTSKYIEKVIMQNRENDNRKEFDADVFWRKNYYKMKKWCFENHLPRSFFKRNDGYQLQKYVIGRMIRQEDAYETDSTYSEIDSDYDKVDDLDVEIKHLKLSEKLGDDGRYWSDEDEAEKREKQHFAEEKRRRETAWKAFVANNRLKARLRAHNIFCTKQKHAQLQRLADRAEHERYNQQQEKTKLEMQQQQSSIKQENKDDDDDRKPAAKRRDDVNDDNNKPKRIKKEM